MEHEREHVKRSRYGSISIATRLRVGRPGFDSRQGWELLSTLPRPDRLCGSLSLLTNGYRGAVSSIEKLPGREADHTPPSISQAKNAWSYTSTPPYVFLAWYLGYVFMVLYLRSQGSEWTLADGM